MRKILSLCLLGAVLIFSVRAQAPDIHNIKSLLLEWAMRDDLDDAALSPNGQQIAWTTESELCLLTLETAQATCSAMPAEGAKISGWQDDQALQLLAHDTHYRYALDEQTFTLQKFAPNAVISPDQRITAQWDTETPAVIIKEEDKIRLTWDETALRIGLPTWIEGPLELDHLTWTGDSAGLVVAFRTSDTLYMHHTLYINIASGEITPFADFSAFSQADMMVRDANNQLPIFQLPRAGVVMPEGDTYLALHSFTNNDYAAVMLWPLPPHETPVQIGEITDYDTEFPPFAASVAADGTVFVGGYLIRR